MNEKTISDIQRHGKVARGQKELIKHLSGERLTLKQAVYAHCYDCTGFYADGKIDCNLRHCALHPFMAYHKNREKQSTRTISDAHMQKMRAARQQESNLLL